MMNEDKILCIVSAATQLTLKNGKTVPTGYFLSELVVPAMILRDAGWRFTYATVNGAHPSLDPLSDKSMWFGFSSDEHNKAKQFIASEAANANFGHPLSLSALTEGELQTYTAVFVPGGHGPMVDLAENLDVARVLEHFVRTNKLIFTLCHGPAALLSMAGRGDFPLRGRRITCWSNIEENMTFCMWGSTPTWRLATRLSDVGMLVSNSVPLSSHVVEDGNLLSAQGPSGARNLGNAVKERLERGKLQFRPVGQAPPAVSMPAALVGNAPVAHQA